jgi:hypothetical protein
MSDSSQPTDEEGYGQLSTISSGENYIVAAGYVTTGQAARKLHRSEGTIRPYSDV